MLVVAVVLPRADWDKLTDPFRALLRAESECEEAPDTPLDERIALFVDAEVSAWLSRLPVDGLSFGGPLRSR